MQIQLPIAANSANSFEAYMRYVSSLPLLTEQQEKDLFLSYQQHDNLSAAQQIVLSHLRFVVYIAQRYKGYGLPMEEIVQEGTVGLMKSVKKFKLDCGVRLASFAVHYIKSEIQEYVIKNWRLVKAVTTKAKRKLFFNLRKLKASNQWLSYQEKQVLAEQLNVSQPDITDIEAQFSQPDLSINQRTRDVDDRTLLTDDWLADQRESFTQGVIEQDYTEKTLNKVKACIRMLDERAKDIIENRWLRSEKLTHKHFAEKYGVSQERIRQIEAQALAKIKQQLEAETG
ncbi:RNA polymerase factor sigma-32 [Thalassotalea sp. LPB0316]|uniref:RNA polymerase factor sigma-32 n=1 Tax=Thalassotalea sp. LPB0316 TaxID=2769490 RepID=UPI0018673954|nr:RNA polymerase factor sigma-32 [Thalassotalea sp. LPB0316]QOL25081.1 RNA polymerase factor sigma-32 [Thalassotalea sp. LPB0316]